MLSNSETILGLFKRHTKTDDFEDDDVLLKHYLDTAEEATLNACNRKADELKDGEGNYPMPILQAVIMLAAAWYDNKEAVGGANQVALPYAFEFLIKPYVKLVDTEQ